MTEFILTLPVLFIIIGMIFTSGQLLLIEQAISNACYEGARAGIVQQDANTAIQVAEEKATEVAESSPFIDIEGNQFDVTATVEGGWTKGAEFTVTIDYTVPIAFPIPDGDNTAMESQVSHTVTLAVENAE